MTAGKCKFISVLCGGIGCTSFFSITYTNYIVHIICPILLVFCSAAMFVIVGECKFGAACKFSHLTPMDKERLLAAGEFKLISTKQFSEVQTTL